MMVITLTKAQLFMIVSSASYLGIVLLHDMLQRNGWKVSEMREPFFLFLPLITEAIFQTAMHSVAVAVRPGKR